MQKLRGLRRLSQLMVGTIATLMLMPESAAQTVADAQVSIINFCICVTGENCPCIDIIDIILGRF